MAVKKVTIPDVGTVYLNKRRGMRGMRLSIAHGGLIRVSLPYWLPYTAGVEFALQKRDWIKSQQITTTPLTHGARIGKAHRLAFVPDPQRQTIATRIAGGEVRIHYPAQLAVADPIVQTAAEKAGLRALKLQAQKLLPQRLDTLASHHDFTYQGVRIKNLKSRWGSCSDKGDIALSCFLMQLPWHLIDYVLLHELTHTRVMAHGPAFWEELGQYVPDLKAIRKEIRSHRPVLLAQDQYFGLE